MIVRNVLYIIRNEQIPIITNAYLLCVTCKFGFGKYIKTTQRNNYSKEDV